jgi:hypothetical protein
MFPVFNPGGYVQGEQEKKYKFTTLPLLAFEIWLRVLLVAIQYAWSQSRKPSEPLSAHFFKKNKEKERKRKRKSRLPFILC